MTNKTELHPRIEGLVREAIAEANGNAAQAAATLERRIRNDSRLLAALMNPLVRDAASPRSNAIPDRKIEQAYMGGCTGDGNDRSAASINNCCACSSAGESQAFANVEILDVDCRSHPDGIAR